MKPTRARAVVLAAGLGSRLRPLTDFQPKPLLPVAGRPILRHTLAALAAAGCEAAAVNLHHLGDRIRERLGAEVDGMPIVYSPEPELRGTLGALAPLGDFLAAAERVIVINGDSLCRWPVRKLLRRHERGGGLVTLMLTTRAEPQAFGGPVGVDAGGRVVAFGEGRRFGEVKRWRVYAGAHVFSPARLGALTRSPADFVSDLWVPMLERGAPIAALESAARWVELGTPARYLAGARAWARGRWPLSLIRRGWIAPGAYVHPAARVRRSVIENGARVEEGAEVESSLVLPGACVTAGCRVRASILGFDVRLASGTAVDQRLITPERADVVVRPVDSVVGGVTYSPLHPPAPEAE